MTFITLDSHIAVDVEMTSSDSTKALPIAIAAISLHSGNLFYAEPRISHSQIPLVGQPGEKGPTDKGPLHVAGFTMDDILMPQKPTIGEVMAAFLSWTDKQSAGRIMLSQGGSDATVIENSVRANGLPWPKRFHSTSDLRSWAMMYILINGKQIPLTEAGTSPMSLEMTLEMLSIKDTRGESHNAGVDAAYTAQIASLLIRRIPFYKDLVQAIDDITGVITAQRKLVSDGVLVGSQAILQVANLQ